jgi:hypothetical protein
MLAELGWKDINLKNFSFQPEYNYIHSNNEHHILPVVIYIYIYQNRVLYFFETHGYEYH